MATTQRPSRHERIRNEAFPDAAGEVFDTKTKGFIPIPIEFRLLLRHLTTAQTRLLLYLHLRSGKEGVSFPTVEEIAHDIGVGTPKHIRPLVTELERKGFIRTAYKRGRTYYLALDPAIAIRKLIHLSEMSEEQLREMNELRENIGRDPILFEQDGSGD
jgi:DNA-binding MarR family transcriptional regulator